MCLILTCSLVFTRLLLFFSVRKCKKQIWCRWTGSHTTLWGEDRLFLTYMLRETSLEPWILQWHLLTICMGTCVVPRCPSLVRTVGISHGLCVPPFYSTVIHNQLNYWIFWVYFNLKLAEWKACLDGEYETRVGRKNKKIRGRQTKHGYISR